MNENPTKTDIFFEKLTSQKWKSARIWICTILGIIALISEIILAFVPICISMDGSISFTAWGAIQAANSEDPLLRDFFLLEFSALLAIAVVAIVLVVFIFKNIVNFSDDAKVSKNTKKLLIVASVFILVYTAFTFIFSPINSMIGGASLSDVSYVSVIIIAVADVIFALAVESINAYKANKSFESTGSAKKHEEERKIEKRKLFRHQLVLLIFTIATFAISTLALMSKIIKVTFDNTLVNIPELVISGRDLLLGNSGFSTQGERILAYCIFLLFFLTAGFAVLSLISFVSRSSQFNKMATSSIIANSVSCILVGLFGQYYKIVQKLNEEMTLKLLGDFSLSSEDLLKYEIKSEALIYTLVLLGVLVLLFILRPLTKAKTAEARLMHLGGMHYVSTAEIQIEDATISENSEVSTQPAAYTEVPRAPYSQSIASPEVDTTPPSKSTAYTEMGNTISPQEPITKDFDPCPAFTEIDRRIPSFKSELQIKQEHFFNDPTLPSLVSYIVQYARDSKHHLSYTDEKVATFFAGLGATRLSILQGMSGTGKTSLPKIVSEALMSTCDIVEVESSWRDKNELLGYYNEFSKIYTPKKFTQALYKACLNSDTLTFIVLDEMNLSRIEYYFSDFLSLMENDPDKREIKLLNLPLESTRNGKHEKYAALVDGHTIKIPQNIWFIGTANRDESTYDISDKVYDRAHTMNFDKRAQKPLFYGEPIPARYLPASELIRLFEEAKATVRINIDDYPVVKKVEMLLEPYNISFGNRIAMQIESFVSIYASCFTSSDQVIHDAFDIILLSKVVKKLELKSVLDKEDLANEFEKIGLKRCAGFIMNLKED